MKLALIGDIHLDERSPRYAHALDVLNWTIRNAQRAGANGFIFLGDLCEGKPTPRVIAAYASIFKMITDHDDWIAVVQGNHEDAETGMVWDSLGVRRSAWNEFQTIHDEATILLVPYPRRGRAPFHDLVDDGTIAGNMRAAAERIAEEIAMERATAEGHAPVIVCGHFTIEGMTTRDAEFELHGAAEVVVPRAAFQGVALAAVGHIHKAQQFCGSCGTWKEPDHENHCPLCPNIIGVGSLIRHSFAERLDCKSYTLVTVEDGAVRWERRDVPAREMYEYHGEWGASGWVKELARA